MFVTVDMTPVLDTVFLLFLQSKGELEQQMKKLQKEKEDLETKLNSAEVCVDFISPPPPPSPLCRVCVLSVCVCVCVCVFSSSMMTVLLMLIPVCKESCCGQL